MSLLTGKAKEDFESWIYNNTDHVILKEEQEIYWGHSSREITLWDVYENLTQSLQNTLTIEWLDSVGIYITPQIDYQLNFYCRLLLEKKEETPTVIIGHDFKSRSGAIEDGIKKANKIYNER